MASNLCNRILIRRSSNKIKVLVAIGKILMAPKGRDPNEVDSILSINSYGYNSNIQNWRMGRALALGTLHLTFGIMSTFSS